MTSSLSSFTLLRSRFAEEDWKDELYHQITTELQKLSIAEKIKQSSFSDFSSAYSQTANYLEIINHRA